MMLPLVSAIMPTRGKERRAWACRAIDCFYAQTYERKELIILDDALDPTFEGFARGDGIHFFLCDGQMTIPEKRNRACELAAARGADMIWHLDSDDWSSPTRMALQVKMLEDSGKALCGYSSMLFHVEATGDAFLYEGSPDYALGSSFLYKLDWWKAHPWGTKRIGSDNMFKDEALKHGQLAVEPGVGLMVARIHDGNTSHKKTYLTPYKQVDPSLIPEAFFGVPSRVGV